MEDMISIIIPAYKEPFLNKTIDSLLKNAVDEIEIIPVFDGWKLNEDLIVDDRVKPIYFKKQQGMRSAINGIKTATGKFIMKVDAHCAFAPGFDKVLTDSCKDNWLMIPMRYSLIENTWERNKRRLVVNYHYINFPMIVDYGLSIFPMNWTKMTLKRRDSKYNIDDTMTFQGSCWLANRQYFLDKIGLLNGSIDAYGQFGCEQLEIGLKYWLGGGEVKVNKNTWYAHLCKMKKHYAKNIFSRIYKKNIYTKKTRAWCTDHWLNNKEPNMIHDFSWLIEKFWQIPTWNDNWQEEYKKLEVYARKNKFM